MPDFTRPLKSATASPFTVTELAAISTTGAIISLILSRFYLHIAPKQTENPGSNVPQKSRRERRKPNETGKVSRRIDRKPCSQYTQKHVLALVQFLNLEQFLK
jgi:hypothetical protein